MELPDPNLIKHENIIICINIVQKDGKIAVAYFRKTKENDVFIWKEEKGCQIVLKEEEQFNQEQFVEFVNKL